MLGCTDEVSAEFFSARSGERSIEVDSTITTRKTMAMAQVIPQYRQSEGHGRRKLLTPDEVLRLPNDQLLIIIRGHNLLKANKFDFENHPMAKEIERTSILDYTPRSTFSSAPVTATPPDPTPVQKPSRKPLYGSAKPPETF